MATTPAPITPVSTAAPDQPTTAPGLPGGFHFPSYLLGLLTALVLAGAALFFWPRPAAVVQLQAPPTLAATPTVALTAALTAGPVAAPVLAANPTPNPLVVFVSGAVAQPGLYTLVPGARVGDALAAAGGLLPEVDMALINQAQPLVDGAQLHIPAPTAAAVPATPVAIPPDSQPGAQTEIQAAAAATGPTTESTTEPAIEPSTLPTAAPVTVQEPAAGLSVPAALPLPTPTPMQAISDAGSTRSAAVDLSGAGALINVNTATSAELESLPAIGPAKAQAIIANRPYATVDDLDRVPGIGPATLEQIRPYVTTE